jgi:large subunit ribosomal protein L29
MKIAELRAKSKEELKDIVLSSKKEQFNLRMQDATGSLENRARFSELRKTVARAMTVMSETPGTAPKAAAPKKEKAAAKKAAPKKAKKEE